MPPRKKTPAKSGTPIITESTLRKSFDKTTLARGLAYFRQGHVLEAVIIDDSLQGKVAGTRPTPYALRIRPTKSGLETHCSCPVGSGCKHAAALALHYLRKPDTFLDISALVEGLRLRTRDELASMLEEIIRHDPSLARRLLEEPSKPGKTGIDLGRISARIDLAVEGQLDYQNIYGAEQELREVSGIADSLEKAGKPKEAAQIQFMLLEGCVQAYENGADDSDGGLGSVGSEAKESFARCVQKVDDPGFRNTMAIRVLDLYDTEDYGFQPEEMLPALVTKENIGQIEERLLRIREEYIKAHTGKDEFFSDFKMRQVKEILIDLHNQIGDHGKAMEIATGDLRTVADYILAAEVLLEAGRPEDALAAVRRARSLEGPGSRRSEAADIYFEIVKILLKKGLREKIDDGEAAGRAMEMAFGEPGHRSFNQEDWQKIRPILKTLGILETFILKFREELAATEVLAEFLLYEKDIAGAASALSQAARNAQEMAEKVSGGARPAARIPWDGDLAMKIATGAKRAGMAETAHQMTELALRSGLSFRDLSDGKIVREVVKDFLASAGETRLRDTILKLRADPEAALFIAGELADISPALAVGVLKSVFGSCPMNALMPAMARLTEANPACAARTGMDWIYGFVMRSHAYYADVVRMLKFVKAAILKSEGEETWRKYIAEFESRFATRKKLMEMVRAAGLI